MINEKTIQDLHDSLMRSVRRQIPSDDRMYATVLSGGTTLNLDGATITTFLKYAHVGLLEAGDVVEVMHTGRDDKRRITVIGKVLSTRTQVGQSVFAYKTASESVTSSTVTQADDHLTLAVQTSSVYVLDMFLNVTGLDAADLKYNFSYPANASLSQGQAAYSLVSTGAAPVYLGLAHNLDTSTPTADQAAATITGNSTSVIVRGLVVTGATAGNVTLNWAQFTSSGTAVVLGTGSYLRLVRVA